MTGYAKATLAVSLFAAAVEVILAKAIAPAWSPDGVEPLFLLFLSGPPAFLALAAWRRREHPKRSKLLFWVALLIAIPGLAVLIYDYVRFRSEAADRHEQHSHPLIVPLVQWVVVLAVWIGLAIREGQEKRAARAAAKKA